MTFWENVDAELIYKEIPRKHLAASCGFDPSLISKGIKNKHLPNAELALRIASFLEVPISFLLEEHEDPVLARNRGIDIHILHKHARFVRALQDLPLEQRNELQFMIRVLGREYQKFKLLQESQPTLCDIGTELQQNYGF